MRNKFVYLRFSQNYSNFKKDLILFITFSIFASILPIAGAFIVKYANEKFLLVNLQDMAIESILIYMSLNIAYAIMLLLLGFLSSWLGRRLGRKIECMLREKLYYRMLKYPIKYFDNTHTGVIVARIFRDNKELHDFSYAIPEFFTSILFKLIPGLVLSFLFGNWLIFLVLITINVVVVIVNFFLQKKIDYWNEKQVVNRANISGILFSSIAASSETKIYTNEDYQTKKFEKELSKFYTSHQKVVVNTAWMQTFTNSAGLIVSFLITNLLGYFLFLKKESQFYITPSNFLFINFISFILTEPFAKLVNLIDTYSNGSVAYKRYEELMAHETETDNGKLILQGKINSIEFKNVSFSYPGKQEKMVENFSLSINSGEKVAFVGKTGCGKSTLLKLLARWYQPTSGEILINGINIYEYTLESIRKNISYVQQNSYIFNETILFNIMFGNFSASELSRDKAITGSVLDEFISARNDGINTTAGPSGANFSGGQRQRLAISRLLIKNSPINLFDEATSALDNLTEDKVSNFIEKEYSDSDFISITVAHRLSTIKHCDKIVVLASKGKIEEIGTFQQLKSNNSHFSKLLKEGNL